MRLCKPSAFALAALLALSSGSGGTADSATFIRRAPARQAAAVYRLDPARSKFMIRAFAGGLLWFKGHDHFVQARDFAGEARLTPGSVSPASLALEGQTLRARGEFDVRRSDFKVPATSAFHGTVRVRDRLKVSFDIVARRD